MASPPIRFEGNCSQPGGHSSSAALTHHLQHPFLFEERVVPGLFSVSVVMGSDCVGFFGFLRVGEFTVASEQHHPCIVFEDVAVDSHTHPSIIRLRLRHAKMDPFGKGVDVYLGASGSAVCPVTALLGFLAVCPLVTGQLFVWQHCLS